jgi:protein-L-isoaspartate(D-aspartate) O-methyltransferase
LFSSSTNTIGTYDCNHHRQLKQTIYLVTNFSMSKLRLSLRIPFEILLLLLLLFASTSTSTAFEDNNSNPMRAWTCHGRNQKDLVDRLLQAKIIKTEAVRKVLEMVDRGNYVPAYPYMDAPQGIGMGQTISAPHMHAHVLEEFIPHLEGNQQPQDNNNNNNNNRPLKILDVGCGSGYLTAALGRWFKSPDAGQPSILKTSGKVFGIDVHQHLVDLANRNIQKCDRDLLDSGTVQVQLGDGWKGLPSEAPFDVIHVGAAAEELPVELVHQLTVGGVMVIPIGSQGGVQTLYKVERVSDDEQGYERDGYKMTQLLGVRYVPLVHPTGNLE